MVIHLSHYISILGQYSRAVLWGTQAPCLVLCHPQCTALACMVPDTPMPCSSPWEEREWLGTDRPLPFKDMTQKLLHVSLLETPHWPELGQMATPSSKEVWKRG